MAMKKSRPAEQLRAQVGQEQRISRKADKPTAANGAYQAAKARAQDWPKGGIFAPDEAQPDWWRPGSRVFPEMIAADPRPTDEWAKRFQVTDAGFAFFKPEPEPEKPMAGGGNKETA